MKLNTPVQITPVSGWFDFPGDILSMGSCFANDIGSNLKDSGFNIEINPFGILFNPVSIMQAMQNSINQSIDERLIVTRDQQYFHYGYHSQISGHQLEDLQEKIESKQKITREKLEKGKLLILTFGTAWVWRYLETNSVAANCHKMPAKLFTKELIDLEKIKKMCHQFFTNLFSINPSLKVILSVSPIRHTRQGMHENNLSKSILLLLTDHLRQNFKNVSYFPAYEIVLDELRDYRFFKEDMIHPSDQAVKYVYERFKETYFDNQMHHFSELALKIKKAEEHQFMNASPEVKMQHHEQIAAMKMELASYRK